MGDVVWVDDVAECLTIAEASAAGSHLRFFRGYALTFGATTPKAPTDTSRTDRASGREFASASLPNRGQDSEWREAEGQSCLMRRTETPNTTSKRGTMTVQGPQQCMKEARGQQG